LIASGADTLHQSTREAFERRTKAVIMEGYGMTENCSLSHSSPIHRPKAGSFGIPVPNVMGLLLTAPTNALQQSETILRAAAGT
jgi:long-chain acyl-CoA synthetase